MQTKRKWRKPAEGDELHHIAVTVTTTTLDAIEEQAAHDRVSRAWAAGKLIEEALIVRSK